MLNSLGKAGSVALDLDQEAGDTAEGRAALQRRVEDWEALARQAFFRNYRRAMRGHPLHPADSTVSRVLLGLFLAEKAIAEVSRALARHASSVGASMQRLTRVARR